MKEDRLFPGPKSQAKDKLDRWKTEMGRVRGKGHQLVDHHYQQMAPVLFTRDLHPLWLGDVYRGLSAFLIAGGPSFGELDHSLLRQPGVLSMGLNNSVKTFRPNLWVSVDHPANFIRSVWFDPTIMKFTTLQNADKRIFDSDEWKFTEMRAQDCPNVVYFRRNECFQPEQYLWEDTINWGHNRKNGKNRSVLLVAIRLLFILGVRRVYLLGVDFDMNPKSKYHFEQNRTKASIEWNTKTYRQLNNRFRKLRPHFEAEDFHIFNCNPKSKLKAFDHVPYEEAVRRVLADFGDINIADERTKGLYDTTVEDKKARRQTNRKGKKKAAKKQTVKKKTPRKR